MQENLRRWLRALAGADRYSLRQALKDACDQCPPCKGVGMIAIAGGWMRCSRCGSWRALLEK